MRVRLAGVISALESAGLLAGVRGELPEFVDGIADDSRAVRAGSLFLAVKGSVRDGHEFLPRAEQSGATVAMVEDAERTT
ncbi:MAG: Mur ligase domain-containing protein, partial [Gemmatimonadales bacterium]